MFWHWHVKPDTQAVAPVQPWPPHCPQWATVPLPEGCDGDVAGAEEVEGPDGLLGGAGVPEPTVTVDEPLLK